MRRDTQLWRDEHGVAHVQGVSVPAAYWGQGFAHATDRGLQILLMRILGQGRASELLKATDDALEIDRFFRRMNWGGGTRLQVERLTEDARTGLQCYCDGINAALSRGYPWELRLLGYRPEPWRPEDSIMIARMIGYLTLQQSQAEMERLLVEMVQARISQEKLEDLFPGLLGHLDVELLQQVKLTTRFVPGNLLWGSSVPRMIASNNWVVSGQWTASGKPILASDIHLEGNRLPSIWYEIVLRSPTRYLIGGSMPGVPGVLTGRNPDVAWAPTYAFMDAVDSWVERCRDARYFREPNQWCPFRQRKETVLRKGKPPVEFLFYENEHGVLDGDPRQEGYYLATQWSASHSGGTTWQQVHAMWNVTSVQEGMETLGRLESAWNFVLADRHGNIGYQMSGLYPVRSAGTSGLVPLPGWIPDNDWRGFAAPEDLPRILNPDNGCFATANHDLNQFGRCHPINLPMGPYRADRIQHLLSVSRQHSVADMFAMHYDLYSPQAERFLEIVRPLLPNTPQGTILKNWDCRYAADSKGAYLFERFYRQLYREVFAKNGFGDEITTFLTGETGIFVDFYLNFDRVLLSERSSWFGGRCRDEIFRQAAQAALATDVCTWGETQSYMMQHLLLGGKLPKWLGFDRGPIIALGGRAAIHQGQIYRSGGRTTTFVPSYRLVTDMATDECRTNLQGGPSDRRFSKWYCSDLENWQTGKYKSLSSAPDRKRYPFP